MFFIKKSMSQTIKFSNVIPISTGGVIEYYTECQKAANGQYLCRSRIREYKTTGQVKSERLTPEVTLPETDLPAYLFQTKKPSTSTEGKEMEVEYVSPVSPVSPVSSGFPSASLGTSASPVSLEPRNLPRGRGREISRVSQEKRPPRSLSPAQTENPLGPDAVFDYKTVPKTLTNPDQVFDIIKVLGEGSFGSVVLIQVKATHDMYALKYLKQVDPKVLEDETATLKLVSAYPSCNKDIVCYYDSFQLRNRGILMYGVLMEYIDGITLDKYAVAQGGKFTSRNVNEVGIWLTAVLAYLHSRDISHRDIKTNNIMVLKNLSLKLIDFGIACALRDAASPTCSVPIGTIGYLAPEIISGVLTRDPQHINEYLKAADIFAAGVTLYILAEGKLPYSLAGNVPVGPIDPMRNASPCLAGVIYRMIDLDPTKRPNAVETNIALQRCLNTV